MSKLSNEIKSNGSLVNIELSRKKEKNELVKSMLDSISGGWVNVFARWDRQL
ncbi:XyeA family putative rSAM-modified RiPP [Providencia stuartii]|uniref:XyeA family cyclophane-containing RiPP triceptide n=1 Tax=Providencia TaxID=586 RepID=UPI0024B1E5FE|nr:XyeA family cyclophane-containing RiPP triceptide [Providencia sp. 2023EL-00965]ELR5299575.1 XyeA family putative rSAM-modified RiPP [Providencia stuartii]MDW7588654.1 XyeA family cyclophane-containing RiPP triceptide [Providencia sp. 2023EL-00965]